MKNDKTGIYGISCNDKLYVGSSVNIYTRWSQHRGLLRKGKHHSPYLQNAWNKYGEAAFSFSIIEECDRSVLEDREQHYVDTLKPAFNPVTNVRSRSGPEVRAKIAAASRARAALITHCPKGHEYTEENTYRNAKSKRICRECNRLRVDAVYANETPEQREERRKRAQEYHESTRAERIANMKAYAAVNRDKLTAYRISHSREIADNLKKRLADPEYRDRYLQKQRERYARRIGRPLIPQKDRLSSEVRAKISATLKARRGTHCPHGHPYDEVNSRTTKSGKIECRTCRNERKRAKRKMPQ